MKTFALAALAGISSATLMQKVDYQFMTYVTQHNKFYGTVEEFNLRKELFAASEARIQEQNSKIGGYIAAHNKFSDWTEEEFNLLQGLKNMDVDFKGVPDNHFEAKTRPNADGVDWRTVDGVVTAVKDQGQCGSCWAFSSIEAIESAYVIAGNSQVVMSEQELVDCTKSLFGNHGCSGGWYYTSYKWLKNNKTELESDYPYTAADGACSYDASKGVTGVSSYTQVKADTASIMAAIAKQPVNVAVSAGNTIWQNYSSGVVTAADNCPTRVDHAVVAVGYGTENGQDYYIVRNSWTASWGDSGYIKIGAIDGSVGVCGINGYVYYPTI